MDLMKLLAPIVASTQSKGKDDNVPIMASEGEYVIPSEIVAMLGDGNSEAGIKVLDTFMDQMRNIKVEPGQKIQDLFGNMKEEEDDVTS